MKFLLK